MIEVINLTKEYRGKPVFCNLSFSLGCGVLGVIGAAESGKTTLLNILAGLSPVTEGSVLIDSHNIAEYQKEAKRATGYLSASVPLYDDMTPYEFLLFVGEAKKVPLEKLCRQIDEALELMSLQDYRNVLIDKLGVSKRKKLGMAQTLLGNPDLILLDEPFEDLMERDAEDMKMVLKMLGQLKSVVVSAQNADEIAELCDEIILLDGHEARKISPEELTSLCEAEHKPLMTGNESEEVE